MPHFISFGSKILLIIYIRRNLNRNTVGYFEAISFKTNNLFGIISKQIYFLYSEIKKNLGTDPIITKISLKTKSFVCFNGVLAFILKFIRQDLISKSDTPAFLSHIDKRSEEHTS